MRPDRGLLCLLFLVAFQGTYPVLSPTTTNTQKKAKQSLQEAFYYNTATPTVILQGGWENKHKKRMHRRYEAKDARPFS